MRLNGVFSFFCSMKLFIFGLLIPAALHAQSYRGLAVLDDNSAWISGSEGHVLRTVNGGECWDTLNPEGYEKKEFRDIHAWDANNALVMSSGEKAIVLRTRDGGVTWNTVFSSSREGVFLDALTFQGKYGIMIGDPYKASDGKSLLFDIMVTRDSGDTWSSYYEEPGATPVHALDNEALYAASGTNILLSFDSTNSKRPWFIYFVTGGGVMNRFMSGNNFVPVPIKAGQACGIYSFCSNNWSEIVAVGGSYLQPDARDSVAAYLNTSHANWQWDLAKTQPGGYRSCVAVDEEGKTYVCTGTNGSDMSTDSGRNWKPLDIGGFNVCAFSKNHLWLAGDKGNWKRVSKSSLK